MSTNNAVNQNITVYTASSSPSIIIPVSQNYPKYVFDFVSIVEATTNAKLYLTFSTDGGSTFLSSYGEVLVQTAQDGGPTRGGANNQSQISMTEDVGIDSSDGGYGYYGQMILYNNVGTQPRVQFNAVWKGSSSTNLRFINGNGYAPGTGSVINAVKFAMSTGNIASGSIYVSGFNV